ncbi:hypothetical protein [Actinoplanes sp. NPDC049599]|uniref:hypothetical protein n=1 Tax=Actinoplanes sp. NPDC049599 TaxID=3363903 RepID=UPI0037AA3561
MAEIAGSRWYWGLKLYLLTTVEGLPVAWCLANPKTAAAGAEPGRLIGEREIAEDPARELGALAPGMVVLADKGLAGKAIERYAAEQVGVLLARPDLLGRENPPVRQPCRCPAVDRVGQP